MNLKDGVFLVKKSAGLTSHDVVAQARRILGHRDVGHCGTLDPMAEGLLVLISGEATKISQYLLEGNKQYFVGVRFGIKTDTLDITGTMLEEKPCQKSEVEILAAAQALQGEFNWNVPVFSAIKVNGEKLYEKAHRGETQVETPTKLMKFWGVEFKGRKENVFYFLINCSKGSYIRSWCEQLGESLNTFGCMAYLERTESSPFKVTEALSLDELSKAVSEGLLPTSFKPLRYCLPHLKAIRVKGKDEAMMKNGVISHDLRLQLIQNFKPEADEIVQVKSAAGELISLIGLEKQKGFQIRRVFKSESRLN